MRRVIYFSIFIFIFSFLTEVKGKFQISSPYFYPIYKLRYFINGKGNVTGTAFFFRPRLLATNLHVIYPLLKEGGGNLNSIKLSQVLQGVEFGSERLIDFPFKIKRIVALSIIDDLAILETDRASRNYLSFRKNPLSVGEDLFVVGYPSGKFVKLKKSGPLHRYFTSIERSFFVEEIEINTLKSLDGMSGSPIIDQNGKVVGIYKQNLKNLLIFVTMNQGRFRSFNRVDSSSFTKRDVSAKDILNRAIQFTYDQAKKGHFEAQYMLSTFLKNLKGNTVAGDYWLNRANNNPSRMRSYLKEENQMEDFSIVYRSLDENFYSFFNKKSFDSEWGISLLEKAARLGSGRAMVGLMEIYWKGQFVERDLDQAIHWALEAIGQNYISVLEWLEKGIRRGDSKAFVIFKTLAEQTDKQWVQFKLSEMYFLKGDVSEGLKLLEKLAESHYPEAQFKLSEMHFLKGGVSEGLKLLEKLVENHYPKAQFKLAQMYLEGSVLEKNFSKAFELLKPLAEGGHSEAQFELALMYRHGKGMKKNLKEANRWLERIILEGGSALPLAYLEMGKIKQSGSLRNQFNAENDFIEAIKNGIPEARLELVKTFLDLLSVLEAGKNDGIRIGNATRKREKEKFDQEIIENKDRKFESVFDGMKNKNLIYNLEGKIEILQKEIEEFLMKAIIHLTILASEGSSFGQSSLNQLTGKYNFMAQAALITSSLNRIVRKDINLFGRLKAPLELVYWYTKSILKYGVQPVHNQVRQVRNKCYQVFKDPSLI